ncbi:glutathione S-transferase family protein [Leisingera sp. SS27]|uniref:glutathione S-transferase family protein n=1 Tax=Leisingera sp. SS27 TaxID=2979462 RepID=UPI00232F9F9E|nr:glutathione S-transferase family protein [Leisingera sp. SS27]MDC0660558.1 glutathione S-transferase family protein [Leisingera sp. SS27]
MKLFDMTGAPNPRRVRVFLAEKGIDVEKVQIDIMGGENLQSNYLAINPRGVLPTVQLDDGSIIDETSAICRYFEETNPEPALYGQDAVSKAQIESWIRQIEGDAFAPTADVLRNSNPAFENRSIPGTDNTPQVPALADRGTDRVKAFYARLDNHLAGSDYVVGENYSAADITAMCAIDFAEYVGIAVPKALGNITKWRNRVSSRPSAQA